MFFRHGNLETTSWCWQCWIWCNWWAESNDQINTRKRLKTRCETVGSISSPQKCLCKQPSPPPSPRRLAAGTAIPPRIGGKTPHSLSPKPPSCLFLIRDSISAANQQTVCAMTVMVIPDWLHHLPLCLRPRFYGPAVSAFSMLCWKLGWLDLRTIQSFQALLPSLSLSLRRRSLMLVQDLTFYRYFLVDMKSGAVDLGFSKWFEELSKSGLLTLQIPWIIS